jgi:hypothetical protein
VPGQRGVPANALPSFGGAGAHRRGAGVPELDVTPLGDRSGMGLVDGNAVSRMRERAMKGLHRRGFLLGLCSTAVAVGCNFPGNMYFLMPEAKEPAEYKRLADENKKKEVKVVIWTYAPLETREEFVQVDRQLAESLAKHINEMSKENSEKVTVIPPRKVDGYKNEHPNWTSIDPEQVGRYFQADYVINVEIDRLSLYEPNTHEMFLRGRGQFVVKLVDVKHPDESPRSKHFPYTYPNEVRIVDGSDMDRFGFRDVYLDHAAKHLAYLFVDHPMRDRRLSD